MIENVPKVLEYVTLQSLLLWLGFTLAIAHQPSTGPTLGTLDLEMVLTCGLILPDLPLQ
jgi:hypothetical protein